MYDKIILFCDTQEVAVLVIVHMGIRRMVEALEEVDMIMQAIMVVPAVMEVNWNSLLDYFILYDNLPFFPPLKDQVEEEVVEVVAMVAAELTEVAEEEDMGKQLSHFYKARLFIAYI